MTTTPLELQFGDKFANRNPTQCSMVLQYMREFGGITPLEAMRDLSVMRLSPRIHELKQRGLPIVTTTARSVNRWGKSVAFARYEINSSCTQQGHMLGL